ncbi:MAG: helix-turn-helix domain-containing protein [Cuspidothrix sp.]
MSNTEPILEVKQFLQKIPIFQNILDEQRNGNIVEIDLPKAQLAALLGTVPETLSRAFYKLSQEGKTEINGTKIKLLNKISENC